MILRAGLLGLLLLCACSDVTTSLVDEHHGAVTGTGGAGAAIDSGTRGDAHAPADSGDMPRAPAQCHGRPCHCDDGRDDDADGFADGLDPECTGPHDDDESSFATGSPQTHGKCRDCFWDDNAGGGKNDCSYAAACLQGKVATGGNCSCNVSNACIANCLDRTPNGCDCFGCCDVKRSDGVVVSVLLEESCSLDKIHDTAACPPCKQSPQCYNACGPCELCPGRRSADLPASCRDAQPRVDHACDEGQLVCDGVTACPGDFYCQLGCCLYVVP